MGQCCCCDRLPLDEERFEERFPGYREKKLRILVIVNERRIRWDGGEDKFLKMCMWCHLPKEHPYKRRLLRMIYHSFRREDLRTIKELVKPEDQRRSIKKRFVVRKKNKPFFNFLSTHSA